MSVGRLVGRSVGLSVGRSVEKNFYSSQEPPALSRGQTRTGPGGGWLPVFSRAPSLIEEGARRTRRGPGGGGPPPSVSLRAPSLIHEEEDEKGASRTRALSLMEKNRTSWSGFPECVIISPFTKTINLIKTVLDSLSDQGGPRTVAATGASIQAGSCEILIVKPTTFVHLLKTGSVLFNQVKVLVLERVDIYIESLLQPEIEEAFAEKLPGKERRQTLAFSKILPNELQLQCAEFLKHNYVFYGESSALNSEDMLKEDLDAMGEEHMEVQSELLRIHTEMERMKTKESEYILMLAENVRDQENLFVTKNEEDYSGKTALIIELMIKNHRGQTELEQVRVHLGELAQLAEVLKNEKSEIADQVRTMSYY